MRRRHSAPRRAECGRHRGCRARPDRRLELHSLGDQGDPDAGANCLGQHPDHGRDDEGGRQRDAVEAGNRVRSGLRGRRAVGGRKSAAEWDTIRSATPFGSIGRLRTNGAHGPHSQEHLGRLQAHVPPRLEGRAPVVATEFAVGATCQSVQIIDFASASDSGPGAKVLQSFVQICWRRLSGAETLPRFVERTYGAHAGRLLNGPHSGECPRTGRKMASPTGRSSSRRTPTESRSSLRWSRSQRSGPCAARRSADPRKLRR